MKLKAALLGTLLVGSLGLACLADDSNSSGSSSTYYRRGYGGVKDSNVFSPKYKERIATYTDQIEMGATKGWLTPAEVESFKKRLEGLKELEASAAAKGWVKADVDEVDKQFTKFNMDFSAAGNKQPAATTPTKSAEGSTSTSFAKDCGGKMEDPIKPATAKAAPTPAKAATVTAKTAPVKSKVKTKTNSKTIPKAKTK